MGIFHVNKKDLNGNIVESYSFKNTILNAGLNYLCDAPGNTFNKAPAIGVGTSDITPDINQVNLILPVQTKVATYSAGISSVQNPQANKTFSATAHFGSADAVGDLTEVAYYMSGGVPLNRTLFSTVGFLDTRFVGTPELDQQQTTDISNLTKVYGNVFLNQTITVSASGGAPAVTNIAEIALSLASSGNPSHPLNVSVYADNAGALGALVGSADLVQFSEPVQRWRTVSFSPILTVTTNSVYHVVVSSLATDLANAYDLFGSFADQYPYGQLKVSSDAGATYILANPNQDLGFITYYNITGAVDHQYVVTMTQYGKETAMSNPATVNVFPVNNLSSVSTSQGTVRIGLPTASELPAFASNIRIYKKVGTTYGLLASTGTIRQYFYDNGSLTPNLTINPPASSIITTSTGLATIVDNTNGGPLQMGQNKYYKVSSLLMGTKIGNVQVGPYAHPGVPGVGPYFYDTAYSTLAVPGQYTEYETTASTEIVATSPSTNLASFADFFTENALSPSLWNITNGNPDYYSLVTPVSTNESQLQLNVPSGVPFVISSTRKIRPGQSYYLNVLLPFVTAPKPQNVLSSGGVSSTNPILNDSAPNRVPIFSFVNPNNIQNTSSDKRLTFEVGMYHHQHAEEQQTADQSQYATGPYFCLYDNVGNTYLFSTTDIQPSHADGAYTFRIDIGSDSAMKINILDPNSHSFNAITSSIQEFNFKTQYNYSHTTTGGNPGPTTQTTNHFLVPQTYSFAIGNPSNDPLSFVDAKYIATNDAVYTIPGLPSTPLPGICMTSNGSITANTGGGFNSTLTWNAVPGVRKYRIYVTGTAGNYANSGGNLLAEYDTYYPCYAVQSTDTPNNDFPNGLVAVGNNVRNWQDIGVTYGVDTTSTGNTNGYALGGFVGINNLAQGNPIVPAIAQAIGSAEGYLLLLTGLGQSALFTFTGGGVDLYAETGPDRGIASIYIDGNYVQDTDFYSEERLEQQLVFTTNTLSPGYHNVQVKYTGTANDFSLGNTIALDYFHINVPALVDNNSSSVGTPLSANDSHVLPVAPPYVKNTNTYNGNGPTVVVKGPAHTMDVILSFSLINPNL